ncbi:hypothetical protein [Campylobacter troglodytis]|uniref:hypothetical protein n=1 Tax=Campylobacter troglodytis TaxID=654363 RepID=UPI00115ABB9B|nr:hypothetical protein [Campylobacter troglodytis]TQR56569.1 hypothetical protein DMC01_09150 [Campylobacter troglodytis]
MKSATLDSSAKEALDKAVNGSGGSQIFLIKLKAQCSSENILQYDDEDLRKLKQYSSYDCGGGFEDRFKAILSCIEK